MFLGGEQYVLKSVLSAIEKLCGDVHRTTFAVILAPITVQLNLVQSAPAWCASVAKSSVTLTLDLPDYSFAPQEYITQVYEAIWCPHLVILGRYKENV